MTRDEFNNKFDKVFERAITSGIPKKEVDKIWGDICRDFCGDMEGGLITYEELIDMLNYDIAKKYPDYKYEQNQ